MFDDEAKINRESRLASLQAFLAAEKFGLSSGLRILRCRDDPQSIFATLLLLAQHEQFSDAVDFIREREPHSKWIDFAIYCAVANGDLEFAKSLLESVSLICDDHACVNRCRICVADAVFTEHLSNVSHTETAKDETTVRLLEFALDALEPILSHVRIEPQCRNAIERIAVTLAAEAYFLLGRMSGIEAIIQSLLDVRPIPLILGTLSLKGFFEPPQGLSAKIRIDHPDNIQAKIIAALLDREIYDRGNQALDHLIALKGSFKNESALNRDQLCGLILETAAGLDKLSLRRARQAVNEVLGPENRFIVYFDVIDLLSIENPTKALSQLENKCQQEDAVYWQFKAKCYEVAKNDTMAASCWERASLLSNHPFIWGRFAQLSIRNKKFADAVKAYEKLIALKPNDIPTLERLASSYANIKEFSKSAFFYQRLFELVPERNEYMANIAVCHARSGSPQEALPWIERAAKNSPNDLGLLGLFVQILTSLGKVSEAFEVMSEAESRFSTDYRFLAQFMTISYKAGHDKKAEEITSKLFEMQNKGLLPEPIFHAKSLDDLKDLNFQFTQRKNTAYEYVTSGKFPWLVADTILHLSSVEAFDKRTSQLDWVLEDRVVRGEWTVYATNSFAAISDGSKATLRRIRAAKHNKAVVADITSLITLNSLGRLASAVHFFGKIYVPSEYGELPVKESSQVQLHQPSRMNDLIRIRDLVSANRITILDEEKSTELATVDEYSDSNEKSVFALADILAHVKAMQLLSQSQLEEFENAARRTQSPHPFDGDAQLIISFETLRTLSRFGWFEELATHMSLCVTQSEYHDGNADLRSYEHRRKIFEIHQGFWNEFNDLRLTGGIVLTSHSELNDEVEENDDSNVYRDSFLLARELNLPLLADDRVLQAITLNERSDQVASAFGTDCLICELEKAGFITPEQAVFDFLTLFRKRFRFLLPELHHLKILVMRSLDNLPGPELREVAYYVQESMCDPGLLSGLERTDPPFPIAFKYFMAWTELCGSLVGEIWAQEGISNEKAKEFSAWCFQKLLPSVPRNVLYSPLGRQLGRVNNELLLMPLFLRLATVRPLERANTAIRAIAESLGMDEDELIKIAARAAETDL